ncbi:MAG: SUMF1/EgtB/PvdO family nonheme iron enzyme, partial [Pseudomonadota bacterium]|nr:SUMF1/EgtB/PvdO family nonheme iron enzyme [Pseudomonadota bacterium]
MDRQTMGAAKKLNYKKVLRDLVPINALSEVHIAEVTKKAAIEDVRSGRYVFRKGDRDYQSVYLLEGTVELIGERHDLVSTVKAGSEDALHPLAHKQPRQLSARASGKVTVARIDSSLLDVLLTWDESAGYDVVEIDANNDDDWMTRMLQSQAFLQLPPSNIHQLLMRLESVNASAGDVVVRQGEDGDYFYIVKNGRLAVTRKASARGAEVLLAELGDGACFGEEALVSETKRNASVTMVTDGLLMRLSKDDFNELLRAPMVHDVGFTKAQKLVSKGAQWLDVRLPGEFEKQAIKGSNNLPLSALRDQCADLDSNTAYIVCCDTGRRSSAGAFVLSQRGFNVFTLKNGLMDVPDEALTNQCTDEPASQKVKDAEIIPFDADSKSHAEPVKGKAVELARPQPVDTALIDKLALAEKEKTSLQQQLERAEQQSAETKAALEAVESVYKEEQSASQQDRQQIGEQLRAAEQEKSRLQADQDATKQAMSQLQASADGRDSALRTELEQMAKRLDQQQQAHDKHSRELEQELGQLRDDYQQLDQRSAAVAAERDAAVGDLDQARQDLASIQQQLSAEQGEAGAQQESLKTLLEQREHELKEETDQLKSLQQQVSELDGSREALEQQIQSVTENADAGQSRTRELEAQLAANEEKLQELEQSLQDAGAREQSLQVRLEQAEQKSADELERWQSEASAQQLRLDDQGSQLQQQQSEREELEQKLNEAQQSLEEAAERERQIEQQLEQGEGSSNQIQKALDQSIADADELKKQLDEAKQQYAGSEQQVLELDSRLNSAEKEHTSDIASLREALTRAQDERENVSREQTRLMGALRKAEGNLERERHDNETEVHRLQKELKEAAGESSAGLAAELDAVQERLKQGALQRDDLEIQLGERSAQMENAQAEAEKLSRQLKQAQDSAHQAELQLVEANQAANEEMTIRLDAEQLVQQAMRDQLETVTSERNQHQEQLTVQNHELEELRDTVQQAQAEATVNKHTAQAVQEAEQQVQESREVAQQLEQARDEAHNLQRQAQQEVDQLRAEAEVSRGLVNMQATMGDSDKVLQAEEKAVELQQEVERLQLELSQSSSIDSVAEPEVSIPSLDENDSQAAAPLYAEFYDQKDDASTSDDSGGLPEDDGVREPSVAVETAETEKTGGSKLLLVMLLAVGLAAAGAYWWFTQKSSVESLASREAVGTEALKAPRLDDAPAVVENPVEVATELKKDVPPATIDKPKILPSFAKGMSASPIPASAEKSIDPETAVPETPAEAEQEAAEKSAAKPEEAATPARTQPVRSFREALKSGGTAPTIVEFRADSFEMGTSSASPNFAERPRHRVDLKRFAIGKHEVTFDQYNQFAQATGRRKPKSAGWGRGIRPVINVSWQDAVAYSRWLSEQTGSRYRLPSEAEWEFAARSGTDKRFWWGNKVGEANANCFDCASEWSGSKTAPVGSFTESPFAVHDMAGNVMEWVQDCYRSGYVEAPDDGSAVDVAG